LNSPYWWEGPDGKRILTWYSRHYHQVMILFGLPPKLEAGLDSLPLFLQMYARPGYTSDATIIFGTQPENTDLQNLPPVVPAGFASRKSGNGPVRRREVKQPAGKRRSRVGASGTQATPLED
jgi:hypothetical protein